MLVQALHSIELGVPFYRCPTSSPPGSTKESAHPPFLLNSKGDGHLYPPNVLMGNNCFLGTTRVPVPVLDTKLLEASLCSDQRVHGTKAQGRSRSRSSRGSCMGQGVRKESAPWQSCAKSFKQQQCFKKPA